MYEKEEIAKIKSCRIENINVLKKKYKLNKIIKLDANENQNKIKVSNKKIRKMLKSINFYPDNNCTNLRNKLSEKLQIPEESFWKWLIWNNFTNN